MALPNWDGSLSVIRSVPFQTNCNASVTWAMPAAATFLAGSVRSVTKADLTGYRKARLVVNKLGTAGAANAILRLRYSLSFSATVTNYSTLGVDDIFVAVNVVDTILDSGWVALPTAQQTELFLCVDGINGDGATAPAFGNIVASFAK